MGASSCLKKGRLPKSIKSEQKKNNHSALILENCSDKLYNCIVKIEINKIISTGFFIKIEKYNEIYFLITCFHCIPANRFEIKK